MRTIELAVLSCVCAASVTAARAADLDTILQRIEERGQTLYALEAELSQRKWTDILQEFDAGESGRFRFLDKGGEIYLRKDIQEPQPNFLVLRKGEVIFYQPSIKQAQRHQLGDDKDKAEFLLLGFGTSREALEKAYRIVLVGSEEIEGESTHVLELTPRSEQVSAFFSRIVLWIDPELWVPVQQKLVEPTEDYLLIRFSDIRLNPKLSPGDFELKIPKDVKFVGN